MLRDEDDKVGESTLWGPPEPGHEVKSAFPVQDERRLEKEIRNRVAFAPDYADTYMRFSLLEKSDTVIKIRETHVTKNAPYVDDFEVWAYWEIRTPDPLSRQVVFRKQYRIKWFSKPLVWRAIRGAVTDDVLSFNDRLPAFF